MIEQSRRRYILRTTLLYAVLATFWILLSDQLLAELSNLNDIVWLSSIKGIAFVIVTSLLLYIVLRAVPAAGNIVTVPVSSDAALPADRGHQLALYTFAVLATMAMLLIRAALPVDFGQRPLLILFMLPIILSAMFGGLGPGLLATATAALMTLYWTLPPVGSLRVVAAHDLLHLAMLVANGVLVSVLAESLRRARRQAQQTGRHLAGTVNTLNANEDELRHTNRVLRALSQSNHALIEAQTEQDYLQTVCDIIIRDCGHAMVWIGYAEQDQAKRVQPMAWAGFEQSYIESLCVSWADEERGRGPTGTAIRSASPALVRDVLGDPHFTPWREQAIGSGYRSIVSLPLLERGQAFGAMTIYAPKADAFAAGEIRLLEELAGDLAYGITSLRVRAERGRAEGALKDSEATYRSLFDNMLNGFAYCRMLYADDGEPQDFVYLKVNAAFEALTGLKGVVGRRVSEVIPGIRQADPKLFEIYGRVARGAEPERFEIYIEALRMWFWLSVYCPKAEHFVAVFDVITERKQAEERLRTSEQRFRRLFDMAPLPLAYVDKAGRIIDLNGRFLQTFGYTQADLPTLDAWWPRAYPDPDYRRWVMETWNVAVQTAIETQADIASVEYQVTCKHGEVRSMVISGITIGEDFLATFFDVTERRTAEEALRARERYQRALLDNFPFMVWLKDPDSRILAANKVYARVANVTDPDQLVGKSDLDYWEPELADHYRADDRAVLDSGKPKIVEEEITEPGRRFWIETYKSPVELDGRIIGTVGFARDITERKLAEDALRQHNEELERFNHATVGRELDMIRLKRQINELSQQFGREPPYPLTFLDASNSPASEAGS